MVKKDMRGRKISEIVEMSQYWDAEDLIRNFDEAMSDLEHGLSHMVWDLEENRVTSWIAPLPVTPKFEISETDKEFRVKVLLPDVAKEKIRLNVGKKSVRLFACSNDAICRPHFLEVESADLLDADSAKGKMTGNEFEVKIAKARKKRVRPK